ILSILMQSSNQKSNALQSIIGIFLHSSHTPAKVVDTLSRMGLSVSLYLVQSAICSLASKSHERLTALGQTLLALYAYNNFDVDLKSYIPTVERSNESLKHLTSGLVFPLQHNITCGDLKCSKDLWAQSELNSLTNQTTLSSKRSYKDLLRLHSDTPNLQGLNSQQQFNSWKFLHNLRYHGPEYFAYFQSKLKEPKPIESIPLVKTPILAARAMYINNLTVAGNIRAVEALMGQGGFEEESEEAVELEEYVVLFHGDLGTGERL
ncbi:hypothetical protein SERLADRAFT_352963, partial [Serpula lacrymans var. lacrymans S7.9]